MGLLTVLPLTGWEMTQHTGVITVEALAAIVFGVVVTVAGLIVCLYLLKGVAASLKFPRSVTPRAIWPSFGGSFLRRQLSISRLALEHRVKVDLPRACDGVRGSASKRAAPFSSPAKVRASLPNGVKLTLERGDVDACTAIIGALGHSRRRLVDALKARKKGGGPPEQAPRFFERLYRFERQARNEIPDDSETRDHCIRRFRQQESIPVLNALKEWLDKIAPKVLPDSKLGDAVSYTLNQWEYPRYTEDGRMAIDNNLLFAGPARRVHSNAGSALSGNQHHKLGSGLAGKLHSSRSCALHRLQYRALFWAMTELVILPPSMRSKATNRLDLLKRIAGL
ncbi:hypothetical protein GGE45_003955 [Rhizobium aethiopicum]|nr:hypothetical protein [Rhizobium aethiopicum]